MNERIKELSRQAAGKGFDTFATSDFDSAEKIEKFAELIVRECASKVTCNEALNIFEHFGVKE